MPSAPANLDKLFELAITQHQSGNLPEAERYYKAILQASPDQFDALHYLGVLQAQRGKPEKALPLIRRAVGINPQSAEANANLGSVYLEIRRPESAMASFRAALDIQPGNVDTLYNLGNALRDLQRHDEALESYDAALAIDPRFFPALNNRGDLLNALDRAQEALDSFERALALKPDEPGTIVNIGTILRGLNRQEEALENYDRALVLKPAYAEAFHNRGNALFDLGRNEEALSSYSQALALKPDYAETYSSLLYTHSLTHDISPEAECSLAAGWENAVLSKSERYDARNRTFGVKGSFRHLSRAGRKLRIGVVSAEIGQHAVAEFLEPILEQIDRERFHIILYPTVVRRESRAARLVALADESRPVAGLAGAKAADQIRADRIDILIDTTAHMQGCRLDVFAHRAAPVQCHYIGYHGTTGLTEMDWFIADEDLLPAACDPHFRERIWRLPRLWVAYKGDTLLPESRWQPQSDGTVWLGTFNNLTKIRAETLSLWAGVMQALPEARLLLKDLKALSRSVQERIRGDLARHGIGGERVEFAAWMPDWDSHMALYDRLDIALDTIPLNSGTTAFDALWMGVPLVALEGNWIGGRMTSTMLRGLGKPEWIARDEDEYVEKITALARDVSGRTSLRATQRALMAGSPLCDATGLTRSLEDAFEAMFDRWLAKRESAA